MSKSLKKISSIALPIAGTLLAPGIGTALGSTLSSAALSGIGGALGGGIGGSVSGGGLKGALLGAALGGGGGYISGGGGIPGLGSIGKNVPLSGVGPSQIQPSGIIGAMGNASRGLSGALSGAGIGGGGFSLSNIGTIASGLNALDTQDEAEKKLLAAQGKAESAISPYNQSGLAANSALSSRLEAGFNPSDLTQDPGYQFRLAEGEKSLQRRLAAAGMSDSGLALKAATEYGQGVAGQTYDDAYNRWLQQNQQLAGQSGQGFNAAGSMADIYGNQGNVGANADVSKSNILTGTLSSVLSGSGNYVDATGKLINPNQLNGLRVIGEDASGNPIYGYA